VTRLFARHLAEAVATSNRLLHRLETETESFAQSWRATWRAPWPAVVAVPGSVARGLVPGQVISGKPLTH
jgi:hypothetical protein